jgi:hypothetical protein
VELLAKVPEVPEPVIGDNADANLLEPTCDGVDASPGVLRSPVSADNAGAKLLVSP